MKVLVVEDEVLIRNSITASLKQNGFDGVLEAVDGFQALEVLKQNKIDIIISDIRMPRMDGIELLQCLREQFGDIIFIVLSGYDLFEYAQNAIKLGAFSYLLKPVNALDLQAVLTQAIQKITKKRELYDHEIQIQIKLQQGTSALRKHFILEIIKGHVPDEEYIQKRIDQYDLCFTKKYFCVVLVGIDHYHSFTNHMSSQDKNLIKYGIENICTEFLSDQDYTTNPFHFDEGVGFVINFNQDVPTAYAFNLVTLFKKIQQANQTFMKFTITTGIGSLETKLSSLHQSHAAAKKAFAQKMIQGDNQIYVFQTNSNENQGKPIWDLMAEQKLLSYFDTNNKAMALDYISNQYSVYFSQYSFDLDDIKQINYQLLILIHKILKQQRLDPESIIGEEFFLYTQVNSLTSIDLIVNWFHEIIEACFISIHEMSLKSTKKLMEKARDYILSNFQTDLSLDRVADHLHISSEYLSREFKKENGENFIDYLLKLRIAKAKEYLQQGTYKTYEIAKLIGFNDEKYFSKVFKKHTGFTPSEYKFRRI